MTRANPSGVAASIEPRRRTLIFVNIVITCIATTMLSTAMTTALPAVIRDMQVDVNTGQWLTSGYSLVMAIMMPLTAFLINRFPTRRLYLASLALCGAGMALCAVAPNFPTMMAARVLQAAGNGMDSAMAQVVLLSIYPPEKRGSVMGWYGLSIGAAPVIAPTIAGIVVDTVGWRAIFWGALAVIVVSAMWALAVFRDVLETRANRFDVLSFALCAVAFGGVTLGVGGLGQGAASPLAAGELVVGAASGVAFAVRQLRLPEPLLELRCFRSRDFAVAVVSSMLLYLVMMGSSTIMPLYVQDILGRSATDSALVMLPGSLAMAVVSPFAGRIYDTFGMRRLFLVGAACLAASNIGMVAVDATAPLLVPAALNTVRCVSIGCLMMPLVTWGNAGLEGRLTAHATALITSLRTVAGAIGSAVFVGVMDAVGATGGASETAMMHGLNVAFAGMTAGAAVLLCVGIMLVRRRARRATAEAR